MSEAAEIGASLLPGYEASLNVARLGPTMDDAREWIKRQYVTMGGWDQWMSYVMLDNIAEYLYRNARSAARRPIRS